MLMSTAGCRLSPATPASLDRCPDGRKGYRQFTGASTSALACEGGGTRLADPVVAAAAAPDVLSASLGHRRRMPLPESVVRPFLNTWKAA